jgi:hypothetical protein
MSRFHYAIGERRERRTFVMLIRSTQSMIADP